MDSSGKTGEQARRKKMSDRVRFEVFKRDKFTCRYCGAKAPEVVLQVDHVHPVSRGGHDSLANLVTSCERCNAGKGDVCLDAPSPTLPQLFRFDRQAIRVARMEALNVALVRYESRGRRVIRTLVAYAHEHRVSPSLVKAVAETSTSFSEFQAELFRLVFVAEGSRL